MADPSEWEEDGGGVGASGRSIVMTHGAPAPKVFVLLHGLTASPLQFAELGRQLHVRGANVLIPRLPRHGHEDRMSTALQHLTAEELTGFGRSVVARARKYGEHVVVAGFSLGGLVAAWMAQHEKVDRVVAISPFLGLSIMPERLASRATHLALRLPNRFVWWNPFLRERLMPAHGYPRYPTHAVAQAFRMSLELFRLAGERAPATPEIDFVLNRSEVVVSNRSAVRLGALWRAHGATVRVNHLQSLPPSHDIIEPLRSAWIVPRVYPELLALVEGPP